MAHAATRYLNRMVKGLFTSDYGRIMELAKNSGFEEIGRCGREHTYVEPFVDVVMGTPSSMILGCYNTGWPTAPGLPIRGLEGVHHISFCEATLLRRTSEDETELLVVCDNVGLLYRGKKLTGETKKMKDRCPDSKVLSASFSECAELDFKAVEPSEVEKYLLSTRPQIGTNKG